MWVSGCRVQVFGVCVRGLGLRFYLGFTVWGLGLHTKVGVQILGCFLGLFRPDERPMERDGVTASQRHEISFLQGARLVVSTGKPHIGVGNPHSKKNTCTLCTCWQSRGIQEFSRIFFVFFVFF